ncbi:MAG: HEAT repeat domain-containing protein, partial [Elusimicrobia bacterium]|nr:HEAT repeat domain-containing protein [Elusimicrobiota bacterium]
LLFVKEEGLGAFKIEQPNQILDAMPFAQVTEEQKSELRDLWKKEFQKAQKRPITQTKIERLEDLLHGAQSQKERLSQEMETLKKSLATLNQISPAPPDQKPSNMPAPLQAVGKTLTGALPHLKKLYQEGKLREARSKLELVQKQIADMELSLGQARTAPDITQFLIQSLDKDPFWLNRWEAAAWLWNLALPESVEPLHRAATADQPVLREMVIKALWNIPTEEAKKILTEFLGSSQWDAQLYAAVGLAKRGDFSGLPKLMEFLQDFSSPLMKFKRLSAIWGLGEIGKFSLGAEGSCSTTVGRQVTRLLSKNLALTDGPEGSKERLLNGHEVLASLVKIAKVDPDSLADEALVVPLQVSGDKNRLLARSAVPLYVLISKNKKVVERVRNTTSVREVMQGYITENKKFATDPNDAVGATARLLSRILGVPLELPKPLGETNPFDPEGLEPVHITVGVPKEVVTFENLGTLILPLGNDAKTRESLTQQARLARIEDLLAQYNAVPIKSESVGAFNNLYLEVSRQFAPFLVQDLSGRGFQVVETRRRPTTSSTSVSAPINFPKDPSSPKAKPSGKREKRSTREATTLLSRLAADLWADGASFLHGLSAKKRLDPTPANTPMDGGERLGQIVELRHLLSTGTQISGRDPIRPFVFHLGSATVEARNAGLEGFFYSIREIERHHGSRVLLDQLDHFFAYLKDLMVPVPWALKERLEIEKIQRNGKTSEEKYDQLLQFLEGTIARLQRKMDEIDLARWVRHTPLLQIFPRAYNLRAKREAAGMASNGSETGKGILDEFQAEDFQVEDNFGILWAMGIYPVGERGRTGTGGGSVYSIRDHSQAAPEVGDVAAFGDRARQSGKRLVLDFVPNHTSMDSKLLEDNPDYFIHRVPDPKNPDHPPEGYFVYSHPPTGKKYWVAHGAYDSYGHKQFWKDTAQLNLANPETREALIRIVQELVKKYRPDGFRVDMSYQTLNRNFMRLWSSEIRSIPPLDFLKELISRIKLEHPAVAFVAEAYDNWDELTENGFDVILSKNDIGTNTGWYDAWAKRDWERVRRAISTYVFQHWQRGGAQGLAQVINHDEPSPQKVFGSWWKKAAFMTLMLPSFLHYSSQEIGFDASVPGEHKTIPFSVPVQIDWKKPNPEVKSFYDEVFARRAELYRELDGEVGMEEVSVGKSGVGYILKSKKPGVPAAVVLTNLAEKEAEIAVQRPDLVIDFKQKVPAGWYGIVRGNSPDILQTPSPL